MPGRKIAKYAVFHIQANELHNQSDPIALTESKKVLLDV
jgi:hypothetical protein